MTIKNNGYIYLALIIAVFSIIGFFVGEVVYGGCLLLYSFLVIIQGLNDKVGRTMIKDKRYFYSGLAVIGGGLVYLILAEEKSSPLSILVTGSLLLTLGIGKSNEKQA